MKKEGDSNTSVVTVLTLNNNISNQLLSSKKEEKHTTDSNSVELWIKSLKDAVDLTDDSRSDHDNNDCCSDQDDLQLGAEATNLLQRKRHSQKNVSSASDSEDSRYSPRRSRRLFSIKGISSQTSLDSDTSCLSSQSLSSLLTARESNPEEILKGLGFRGPNVFENIPDRFICTGTRCQGINTDQFLDTLNVDSLCEDSDIPPWVMARIDEIPRKFLQSSTSNLDSSPESSKQCSVPLVKEPTSNAEGGAREPGAMNLSRPPKSLPFPSRFGTFLDPVSEEVELSSQGGSVNLSPVSTKNLSFESNRSSTLKSNSHDETSEGIMKIPSLKDLWESQPSETDHFGSRDGLESGEVLTDDVVEYAPGLNSLERADEGRMSDDVLYRTGDNSPGLDEVSWAPGEWGGEGPSEDIVAVDENVPEKEKLIPTILDCLASEAMLIPDTYFVSSDIDEEETDQVSMEILGDHSLTSDLEKDDNDVKEEGVCTNATSQSTNRFLSPGDIKIPIPIVKVTSPSPQRKISTVVLPDYSKLVISSHGDSPENNVGNLTCSNNGKLEELSGKVPPRTTLQLNFYEKWVVTKTATHPQVHISNKTQANDTGVSSLKNFKVKDFSVQVKPSSHFPSQIVLPQIPRQNIQCFVSVGRANSDKVLERASSAAASVCCSEDSSGFVSMATQSNYSCPEDEGNHRTNDCGSPKKKLKLDEGEKVDTDEWARDNGIELALNYQKHDAKKDSVNFCANVRRTDNGKMLRHEQSFEEELDGLQSSLKGVSLYKAGIHLMQLASSIESFTSPEPQPVSRAIKSSQVLLGSIQNELSHLEGHIKHVQKELTEYKNQKKNFGEKLSRKNDVSELTRELLREQVKMFNSISSSVSPSPSSTPNTPLSCEETLPAFTEDFSLRDDIRNLRIDVQTLREENEGRHSMVKNEILSEVRTEIKNCFSESFLKVLEGKSDLWAYPS